MKAINKIRLLIVTTVCVFLLNACLPDYQPPQQGQIANLTFVQTSELKHSVLFIYKDSYDCHIPEYLNPSNGVIKIPANQEVAFNLKWLGGFETCNLIMSFYPEENQSYLFLFEVKNNMCLVSIGKILNGKLVPVKFHPREANLITIGTGAAFCKPLKNAR